MESSTPLELYLEKLAAGERELAPIICQKLAQQLVYVPVVLGGKSKTDGKFTFQVVKLPEGSVPVFTTEAQYKSWAATSSEGCDVFSVLGGDLCTTLGTRATVILDLGAPHSSVLDNALMQLVASSARETVLEERNLRIDQPQNKPIAAGSQVAPGTTTSTDESATTQYANAEQPSGVDSHPVNELLPALIPDKKESDSTAAVTTPKPILDPLRGRSNPTSMMERPVRPKVELDEVNYRKRLLLDAGKPIITTRDPDSTKLIRDKDDPKKSERRSLLKFLGG